MWRYRVGQVSDLTFTFGSDKHSPVRRISRQLEDLTYSEEGAASVTLYIEDGSMVHSITTASAATNATAAGRRLAREKNVLRHRGVQRIAIRSHRVAGERRALPWLDPHHVGARASGEQRRAGKRDQNSQDSHIHDSVV